MLIGKPVRFLLGLFLVLCAAVASWMFYLAINGSTTTLITDDNSGYYCRALAAIACLGCVEIWISLFQRKSGPHFPLLLTIYVFSLTVASGLVLGLPLDLLGDGNTQLFLYTGICGLTGLSLILMSDIRSSRSAAM